ncbi:Uncharacterized membrane protein [Dethiosulfatibacter aminovorans DSM 17477]|uniref:Uncharacterized membrane protein n=1 Tax=Dethiosulfatibacter aminovorans DSM 17477 TaxID=1121476 RepID=A0A1M6L7I8_9FIRM|nr:QueT transporter family protein [Dethiosulfatibacter aminovorans]SHJ67155.1 Uncharacterized membrane protein [Dethiosulfatibacter aminovorans DSM 17477]
MRKFTTESLVRSAMLAALYVAVTLAFEPVSYGQVQFRISEILVLFAFLDPMYSIGLTLGCAIANMFSPLGIMDVLFGTTATFIAIMLIVQTRKSLGFNVKSLFVASLWPAVANGVIIGIELNYLFQLPLLASMVYVAAGEVVVVSIVGVLIFNAIISNKKFVEMMTIR